MRRGIGEIPQIRQFSINFRRNGRHLVTQAKIQGQVASKAPVVLHVAAEDILAKIAWREGTGDSTREFAGGIGQKRLQIPKGPNSIWIGQCRGLQHHVLRGKAEFDGMGALGPESVVIHLKRIPSVQIRR